ncbi:MAG: hypothetical protein GX338_10960 [Firmicutes bacterium]|nr:hypothetical protein [Bacillota bacterium]
MTKFIVGLHESFPTHLVSSTKGQIIVNERSKRIPEKSGEELGAGSEMSPFADHMKKNGHTITLNQPILDLILVA